MEESKLVEIEMKLAHQDQILFELNEVVTNQQTQLMRLEELCTVLVERLRALADDDSSDGGQGNGGPEERPPHY